MAQQDLANPSTKKRSAFILGCPRSGTSIFFKVLSTHPDFCTTTNLTRRFMARFWMVRIAELLGARHRPVEAGKLWKSFWPGGHREATENDVTDEQRRILRHMVDGHTRHFRCPVFLAKKPGLSMRSRWLAEALPEARFIQLVRDGRSTAASILRQCRKHGKRWSIKPAWPELKKMDYSAFSGALWTQLAVSGDESLKAIDPSRVLTVRYEDFAESPRETLAKAAEFCGVEWGPEHDAHIPSISNHNGRWDDQITNEERDLMLEQLRPGLEYFRQDLVTSSPASQGMAS